MKNVYVIGPTFGFDRILPDYGYTPWTDTNVDQAKSIEIVAFMGGADISPELYGEKQLPDTYCLPKRDEREIALWNKYRHLPKLGICRGAQLLNVLNGGSMFQDVDRHHGAHMVETKDGTKVLLCSVHHQLMIPAPKSELIAWTKLSTTRKNAGGTYPRGDDEVDPEVLWIPEDKALCFQAHPEFGPQTCTDYFFKLVKEYIG